MSQIFDIDLLQFGITNICNNNCIMCHQSQSWYKPGDRGYMKFDHAKKLIDDIYEKKIRFKVVHTFWKGEPFLNPDFLEIIEYLFIKNSEIRLFEKLYINTNATVLTGKEEELLKILNKNSNIYTTINFSIDACTHDTYKSIRRSDYYNNIESSIKRLIELREFNKYNNPVFIFQIVIQKLNYFEVDDFVKKWKDELALYDIEPDFMYYLKSIEKDTIFFRPLQPETDETKKYWMDCIKKYLPHDYNKINDVHIKRIHANSEKKPKLPCFHLWNTPVIGWDGSITACCSDFYIELLKETDLDFEEDSFSRIWYGKEMEELRRKSYFCEYHKMPEICNKCIMYLELSEEFKMQLEKWAKDRGYPVLYSSDPAYSEDVEDLMNIANKYLEDKKYEKCYNLISRALKLDPENEKARAGLLTYYSKTGSYREGIILCKELLKVFYNPKYLEELSFFYENTSQYEKAFDNYKELYLKYKKDVYLKKMIDMSYFIKNIFKIDYLIWEFDKTDYVNDKDFIEKMIDIFYLNKSLFKHSEPLKFYSYLLKWSCSCDDIDKDFVLKVFYIKREYSLYGDIPGFKSFLRKHKPIIDEKKIIELIEFENLMLKDKDFLFTIVKDYIVKEIEYVFDNLYKFNFTIPQQNILFKNLIKRNRSNKNKILNFLKNKKDLRFFKVFMGL